jgi:hypothetical protein
VDVGASVAIGAGIVAVAVIAKPERNAAVALRAFSELSAAPFVSGVSGAPTPTARGTVPVGSTFIGAGSAAGGAVVGGAAAVGAIGAAGLGASVGLGAAVGAGAFKISAAFVGSAA